MTASSLLAGIRTYASGIKNMSSDNCYMITDVLSVFISVVAY